MLEALVNDPRVTLRTKGLPDPDGTCIVYWMQRAQRAVDNPALDIAIEVGDVLRKPVVVFFGLHPSVDRANLRHYHFLVEGLADVRGCEPDGLVSCCGSIPSIGWPPSSSTCDLRLRVPFWTVNADVVVPSKLLKKEQYAARTIRPRLHKHLDEFLVAAGDRRAAIEWRAPSGLSSLEPSLRLLDGLPVDRSTSPVSTCRGGTAEARRHVREFVRTHVRAYDRHRNRPERPGTSRLSPYLHFGHIGPREVALAVRDSGAPSTATDAFVEQLVVRRELAINFATFNRNYDRLEGCEHWGRRTRARHRTDTRPFIYSESQLESADTHDPLWNAAQMQMATTGWMHGYMRMYWAKKILEWTASPEEAFSIAVTLNDRYELDGRDPNGYANIAWAIGGKHDRPWPPRPVFGAIRSMSHDSTARKFDARGYVEQFRAAAILWASQA